PRGSWPSWSACCRTCAGRCCEGRQRMSSTEVRVPDIVDFGDVPVTEILVAVGDEVAVEDPLVTLESDKATMDVPAPFAGVVKELSVSVGDRVSEGSLLLTLDGAGDGAAATETPAASAGGAAAS